MAKVTIEIDDGALAAAAEELGTVGAEETVRAAVERLADRHLRAEELKKAAADELGDEESVRRAVGRAADRHRRGTAFAELQRMADDGRIDLEFLQELHDAEKAVVARHAEKHKHGDPRAA